MNGYVSTDIGGIEIDNEVVAQYAGSSAIESFGVVGMAAVNMKDGFAKLLKRESLSRGVSVTIEENKITIIEEKSKSLEDGLEDVNIDEDS